MCRLLVLMSADQNTSLKFFAGNMSRQMESNGLPVCQWGSRKDRRCVDTAMSYLMSYENARVMKTTMGEIGHDCKSCFDRMVVAQSNIYAQKHNLCKELLKCRALSKRRLRRRVKTGIWVSKEHYREEKKDDRLDGECQASGDVPILYLAQSSVQ